MWRVHSDHTAKERKKERLMLVLFYVLQDRNMNARLECLAWRKCRRGLSPLMSAGNYSELACPRVHWMPEVSQPPADKFNWQSKYILPLISQSLHPWSNVFWDSRGWIAPDISQGPGQHAWGICEGKPLALMSSWISRLDTVKHWIAGNWVAQKRC